MANIDGQTVLWDHLDSSCQTFTDAVWTPVAWGVLGGTPARTICESHVYWGVCDRFRIEIDITEHYIAAIGGVGQCDDPNAPSFNSCVAWEFQTNLTSTYCHELGHTAGVHHFFNATNDYNGPAELSTAWRCMQSAWITQPHAASTFHAYNATHTGLINANM